MANPTITVTRKDNGVAEYKFTHGNEAITGSGFWDDTTPWASGDYKASYWLFKRLFEAFRFGTPTTPNLVPNRTEIILHRGENTGDTEGCLIDADGFLGRVYTYLRGKDVALAPKYLEMLGNRLDKDFYNKNWTPIDIKVEGDYSYDVQLSINGGKSSFTEGDKILLEISLTGPGAANGLSKDIWFHLNFSGTGSLKSDLKSNNVASLPSNKTVKSGLKNDNQWVKISAGQQKVTVALDSIFDDLEEGTENFNVTIDDYYIRRVSHRIVVGEVFYKSEGSFPINGSNDSISFELKDQKEIFNSLIESGGQGNFTFTAPVAPKQIITGQFTSYSVPDRLIIKDGTINLLDTGSVSVTGMPINFRIPDNSAGNITVTVEAPLGGTLWNFSLVSGGFTPKNQRSQNNFLPLFSENLEPFTVNPEENANQQESQINTYITPIVSESEVYLEAQSIQPKWVVNTYTTSILTEGKVYDTGQATRFAINRNGDTNQTEEIGWRVKPTGDNPISANDFDSSTLPEGILTLLPNVQTTIDINFERLDTTGLSKEDLDALGPINDYWGLKQDGLQEGEETWTIELFDPSSGNIIPASFDGSSVFSVFDDFFFVEPEIGTDDGELLEADSLPSIIFGSGGDDTIIGSAGDDTLYGDNGDDIINGGMGDDIVDGGFGNDTIDGGTGNDTLRISRPKSKIALTRQSDGSYLLEDLSNVSFGNDVLKSIETIEFSDETIQLDANITLTISPASVTEDGTTNLVYTFTRTGVTTDALTVNYTVGGIATFNTDYTQTGAASFTSTTGTVSFAANSATATVTVDPTTDTTVEPDETVALTLASGTGYAIGTTEAVVGIITDNDNDTDTPGNLAPTDLALSATTVNENVAPNTVIGTFSSTDPDTGNSFTYSLVAGTGDTDNTAFSIVGNQLQINNSPDFETKNSYSIRVKTTDQGGLGFEKVLVITVNDLNETPGNLAPTDLTLSATTVNENVAPNTVIGTFSSTDPDTGNSFTYSLIAGTGDTDNTAFSIVGNQLQINNSPDFETKNSYSIRVKTTDQGGLGFEKVLVITVNDLNETPGNLAPTAVIFQNAVTELAENVDVTPEFKVADLLIEDDGLGTNNLFLTGRDRERFLIQNSALFYVGFAPNFEAQNSYEVTVNVDDPTVGVTPDLTQTLTLNITDVNEAPTALILANSTKAIAENSDTSQGVKVADIQISDDALGTNSLSLLGNDQSSFQIRGRELFFIGKADFEAQALYNLTVAVTDTTLKPAPNATPDATVNFTLEITNLPDQAVNPQTIQFNNTGDGQGSLVFNFSDLPGSIQVKAIEEGLQQTGAFFNNVVGLYPVADDNGAVFDSLDLDGDGNATELIQPSQAGYARTALSQAVNNFILRASGEGANQSTTAAEFGDVLLEGGRRYAPFVIANGGNLGESLQGSIQAFLSKNPDNVAATLENYMTHEVAYFSFGAANPDGAEHLRSRGNNIFGFEDLPGNLPNISDNDFNDGILAFNFIA
jgi:hypothetical protein